MVVTATDAYFGLIPCKLYYILYNKKVKNGLIFIS